MSRIPYDRDPDFTRPPFELASQARHRMRSRLVFLYGEALADRWLPELERVLKVHHAHKPPGLREIEKDYDPTQRFSEKDLVLITYGDAIGGNHGSMLEALHRFVQIYNRGVANTIHLLPFFPYSSDHGFAVVDFKTVDPKLGTWEAVRELGVDYDLMFDAVLNHCSSRSEMFREFLKGNPHYRDFFIAYESPDDLTADQRSKIFRPRTSEILTRFETIDGPRYVWTTFSQDQVDLNYRNPAVLLAMIEALLFYVRRGADILRLDAATYLWAEPGTECVHLPETHTVIKLARDVMDAVAPGVAIVTETNVPHAENIAYFGNGYDEAHMVYNFALPPLVLHTFYTGDASALSEWADGLTLEYGAATYFNMLDTHDGVGLMGVKGILSAAQIEGLVEKARQHGAHVSYKGSVSGEEPYEINTTWWSAINGEAYSDDLELRVNRYAASRSLQLVLKGVPGVYTHGALALPNDHGLVEQTGVRRDINRGPIDPNLYADQLQNPQSKRSRLRRKLGRMSLIRTSNSAFHPHGFQRVLHLSGDVFAVLRISPDRDCHVLALTNVAERETEVVVHLGELGVHEAVWSDLLHRREYTANDDRLRIGLSPYQVSWLTPRRQASEGAPTFIRSPSPR
jgi:glycosidase